MYDSYGEVRNCPEAYKTIALSIKIHGNTIISWTDDAGSHFDILFAYRVPVLGRGLQGGIRPETDLFVSIMRVGSFSFKTDEIDTHYQYYGEKFGWDSGKTTGQALADLINNVKRELSYE